MKRLLFTLAVLVIALGTVHAEETAATGVPGIPTPPGAKVTTEMNVERDQIIAQLGMMMSMQRTNIPKLSEDELGVALGSLESTQFAEMKVSGKYSATDMLSLFEREVAGRRVIWNTNGKPGSGFLLVATPEGGYFGAQISPTISKQGRLTAGTIRAVRTTGFIDVANAIKLALPLLSEMGIAPKIGGRK